MIWTNILNVISYVKRERKFHFLNGGTMSTLLLLCWFIYSITLCFGKMCILSLHNLSSFFYFFIYSLPGGSDGKLSACSVGHTGSTPEWGSASGEGNGSPLQYSCLKNPMDRGAWWATIHGVTENRTWLSGFHTQVLYKALESQKWIVKVFRSNLSSMKTDIWTHFLSGDTYIASYILPWFLSLIILLCFYSSHLRKKKIMWFNCVYIRE